MMRRARLLITGANGHLGRRLIRALPDDWSVVAAVRSERARRVLERHVGSRPGLAIALTDPCDPAALAAVAQGATVAVHLIGTIKETRDNRYADSHERPAQALAAAAARAGFGRIVYLSILGASVHSSSRCLRARAAVEAVFHAAGLPASIIRVPMVLGEGDRASGALARRAAAKRVFLYRAASLEQPIYAGDVVAALLAATSATTSATLSYDLAGPVSLTRRELVLRAAETLGRQPRVHSLPLALGLAAAGLMEHLVANPPVTRDMLHVLDHDDAIDPGPAVAALGLTLTALDTVLERCVGARRAQLTGR